jgi:hypothetical protein
LLAYLFWHGPDGGVDPGEYERDLAGFHELLGREGLEGFHGSLALRIEGAPWLPAGLAYEDWYLLKGSEVLDPLNELAVSRRLKEAHDRPAHAAGFGWGGLYRLIEGRGAQAAGWSTWLRKPRGFAYPEFYRLIAPWTHGPEVSLWRRQMVLGPAPEFCILGAGPVPLPPETEPVLVRREVVYLPRGGEGRVGADSGAGL